MPSPSSVLSRRIGILAGGGTAPLTLIEACQSQGIDYYVFCLDGQADANLAKDLPHKWMGLGEAKKLKATITEQGITEIVMIGRVRRPSLRELKPDTLALKVMTRAGVHLLGDDGLLRSVSKAMEEECGVRVIAVQDVFGGLLMPAGVLGHVQPDTEAQQDIARGIEVARALGALDIGQAVVVQQGLVLGVEAIEGTDALIARAGTLKRDGAAGVLVKLAKPQQDSRFDLPTIGPDTVVAIVAAGLGGIAIEAGRSLLVERDKVREAADKAGIFVYGFNSSIPESHL